MEKRKTAQINLRVQPSAKTRFDVLAAELGVSKSKLLVQLLMCWDAAHFNLKKIPTGDLHEMIAKAQKDGDIERATQLDNEVRGRWRNPFGGGGLD